MDIPSPALALLPATAAATLLAWWVLRRGSAAGGPTLKVPYTTLQQGLAAGPRQLSVLSYNTLCDALVQSNRAYHSTAAWANLLWDNRWPRLQAQLLQSQADVLALQEVDPLRWSEFEEALNAAGYDGIMQDRRKDSLSFSLAFFYRRDRVRLLWQESRTRTQLAAFQLLDGSNQVVYIVNMHLEGNPYRAGERVNQIRSCLRRLQGKLVPGSANSLTSQQTFNIRTAPVLMLGDFNSSKRSCVYRFASTGYLPAGSSELFAPGIPLVTEDTSHAFDFVDTYDGAKEVLPFTYKHGKYSGQLIDFILYSPATLRVSTLLRPLEDDASFRFVQRTGIPNDRYPSDHLPIGAVFDLTPAAAAEDAQDSSLEVAAAVHGAAHDSAATAAAYNGGGCHNATAASAAQGTLAAAEQVGAGASSVAQVATQGQQALEGHGNGNLEHMNSRANAATVEQCGEQLPAARGNRDDDEGTSHQGKTAPGGSSISQQLLTAAQAHVQSTANNSAQFQGPVACCTCQLPLVGAGV